MTFQRQIATLAFIMCTASAAAAQDKSPADSLAKRLALAPDQYASDEAANKAADELEKEFPAEDRPEAVKMMLDILRHADIGPRAGWFGPAQSRYDWKWLAELHELPAEPPASDNKDAKPPQEEPELAIAHYRGGQQRAKVLDRDGDGSITPGDLDWSDRNPWVQQAQFVGRMFRRMNASGDGRLTRDQWLGFFERATSGGEHLLIGDLRDALLNYGGGGSGDVPSRETLVRGLIAGEIGSIHEGPNLGDAAPSFTLRSPDGSQTYELAKMIGRRPVVLVFGNFTCGPFRSYYPEVETLYSEYKDVATFLMIYVREAHPTDGWAMEANTKAKVAVKQPTTLAERAAVCNLFGERLKATVPLAVDDVNDATGNAYSGMPARLYLIDPQGKVAYKSGRGPFGFKVGEVEQALVMALLEASEPKAAEK